MGDDFEFLDDLPMIVHLLIFNDAGSVRLY